jgi:hypothetical protein
LHQRHDRVGADAVRDQARGHAVRAVLELGVREGPGARGDRDRAGRVIDARLEELVDEKVLGPVEGRHAQLGQELSGLLGVEERDPTDRDFGIARDRLEDDAERAHHALGRVGREEARVVRRLVRRLGALVEDDADVQIAVGLEAREADVAQRIVRGIGRELERARDLRGQARVLPRLLLGRGEARDERAERLLGLEADQQRHARRAERRRDRDVDLGRLVAELHDEALRPSELSEERRVRAERDALRRDAERARVLAEARGDLRRDARPHLHERRVAEREPRTIVRKLEGRGQLRELRAPISEHRGSAGISFRYIHGRKPYTMCSARQC